MYLSLANKLGINTFSALMYHCEENVDGYSHGFIWFPINPALTIHFATGHVISPGKKD